MINLSDRNFINAESCGENSKNEGHIYRRINRLLDRYLAFEHLDERLRDLPRQFENPQPRPWGLLDWQIDRQQIVGIDPDVFLSILVGAIDTEAPIRAYTQTSRLYLEALHPSLAGFVGGTTDSKGVLLEPGLWEKEERQHSPALIKIYVQLAGEKVFPTPRAVRQYQPSDDRRADLYQHGLHRIATEYGATCLYLWLMAHSTGSLHAILAELAQDEINHMTKFWGFGVWAFPESSVRHICLTLLKTMKGRMTYQADRSSLSGTLHRMMNVLSWRSWSWTNRATFSFTCLSTLWHLWRWNQSLTPDYLQSLFGKNQA